MEKSTPEPKKYNLKVNLGYRVILFASLLVAGLSYLYCTKFSNFDAERIIRLQNAEAELSQTSIYSFSASDIKFKKFKFGDLKGKVGVFSELNLITLRFSWLSTSLLSVGSLPNTGDFKRCTLISKAKASK